jgi:hypothetical protein
VLSLGHRWLIPLLSCLLLGCVERELVVESEPVGTEIYVDGTLAGVTSHSAPVRVGFDFYGTRRVTARCSGYLPIRRDVELCVPWYQVFPLGFFSDVLWPGTIHDEHRVRLRLRRRPEPGPAKDVVKEAQDFARRETGGGGP